MRDQVLCGDKDGKAAIGTERVGFFPLGKRWGDDGEGAEEAIVKAYWAAGYSSVRRVFACGCLEAVEFERPLEIAVPAA